MRSQRCQRRAVLQSCGFQGAPIQPSLHCGWTLYDFRARTIPQARSQRRRGPRALGGPSGEFDERTYAPSAGEKEEDKTPARALTLGEGRRGVVCNGGGGCRHVPAHRALLL